VGGFFGSLSFERESRCRRWPLHPGFFTVSEESRKHHTSRRSASDAVSSGLPASLRFAHRQRSLVGVFFRGESVLPFPAHLARRTTPYRLLQRHFEHLARWVRSPEPIVDHTLHHPASAAAWTSFLVHQLAPMVCTTNRMKHRERTIARQVEVCGTRKKCPPRFRGATLYLLEGEKDTDRPRGASHQTCHCMSDSKPLISHHLGALAVKAAQIDALVRCGCALELRAVVDPLVAWGARGHRKQWPTGRSNFKGRWTRGGAVRYGANCEVAASDRLCGLRSFSDVGDHSIFCCARPSAF
jgi:hypothetical protein